MLAIDSPPDQRFVSAEFVKPDAIVRSAAGSDLSGRGSLELPFPSLMSEKTQDLNLDVDWYSHPSSINLASILQSAAGSSPVGGCDSIKTAEFAHVENILLDWYRNPSTIADDDIDPVAPVAIVNALTFIQRHRDTLVQLHRFGEPLHLRGVTVGSGGAISIEFSLGKYARSCVFKADGSAEQIEFVSNRLRSRVPICMS